MKTLRTVDSVQITRALKVLAFGCLAIAVALLWAALTYSFLGISEMVAFEDNSGTSLVIVVPVLALMAAAAIAALVAIGRQIAAIVKESRPSDRDHADPVARR